MRETHEDRLALSSRKIDLIRALITQALSGVRGLDMLHNLYELEDTEIADHRAQREEYAQKFAPMLRGMRRVK